VALVLELLFFLKEIMVLQMIEAAAAALAQLVVHLLETLAVLVGLEQQVQLLAHL
jgi:hypothetical protein